MTVRTDNYTFPPAGKARYAGTVTATINRIDMNALFGGDNWNKGQMFSIQCTVPFFVLTSDVNTATIDTASTDGSNDEPAGPFPAEEKRFFMPNGQRYVCVVRSGGADGIARVWESSTLR